MEVSFSVVGDLLTGTTYQPQVVDTTANLQQGYGFSTMEWWGQ